MGPTGAGKSCALKLCNSSVFNIASQWTSYMETNISIYSHHWIFAAALLGRVTLHSAAYLNSKILLPRCFIYTGASSQANYWWNVFFLPVIEWINWINGSIIFVVAVVAKCGMAMSPVTQDDFWRVLNNFPCGYLSDSTHESKRKSTALFKFQLMGRFNKCCHHFQ